MKPASAEAHARARRRAARLRAGAGRWPGSSSIDLRGRLDRISPITATASARAAFDGALVEALAPGTDLAGRVEADATVEVKDDGVTGTLATTSPALTLKGVGPWAASGRGRFEGPRLVLESLEAKGYGGRLVAEGPLALLPSARTDVQVRAEGIDVAALAAAFTSADVPVAARADGSLRWATTGWDVDAAKGTGEITLRPSPRAAKPPAAPGLPLSGSGRVRIAGRTLALEGAAVEAHGARVTADAALGRRGHGARLVERDAAPRLGERARSRTSGRRHGCPRRTRGRSSPRASWRAPRRARRRARTAAQRRTSPPTAAPTLSRRRRATRRAGSSSRP